MSEKAVMAIQHVTQGALDDESESAVVELDKAGELIDELVRERLDGSEGQEEKEVKEDQPPQDGGIEEEDSGVRAKMNEKVGTLKESVPTPQSSLVLAGLGVVAALAAVGARRALNGRREE